MMPLTREHTREEAGSARDNSSFTEIGKKLAGDRSFNQSYSRVNDAPNSALALLGMGRDQSMKKES